MITKSIHLKIFIYIILVKFDLNYKTKHLQQKMELNDLKTMHQGK